MTLTVAAGAPTGLAGGHEELVVRRGPRSGHTMIVAIHSTVRGPAAGGVRLWGYPSWQDGVDDALRLSEAMTHKCALADLPHGGAKSVLALPGGAVLQRADRRALFLDLGDLVVDLGGRYLAGEDVGTTATDLAVVAERTPDALCLPEEQGGIGEPSAPTAAGSHAALRTVAAHLDGEATLEGLRIGIHGFGQVGSRIAALAAATARICSSRTSTGPAVHTPKLSGPTSSTPTTCSTSGSTCSYRRRWVGCSPPRSPGGCAPGP
jgi:glutamate dehydrogenase/leucine dehydrogenase